MYQTVESLGQSADMGQPGAGDFRECGLVCGSELCPTFETRAHWKRAKACYREPRIVRTQAGGTLADFTGLIHFVRYTKRSSLTAVPPSQTASEEHKPESHPPKLNTLLFARLSATLTKGYSCGQ